MKNNSTEQDFTADDLDEEYDLAPMPVMPKGRYAPDRRVGHVDDDDPWAQLLARNEALDEFAALAVDAPDGDEPRTEKPGAMWEIKSEADFLKLEELLAYIRSL